MGSSNWALTETLSPDSLVFFFFCLVSSDRLHKLSSQALGGAEREKAVLFSAIANGSGGPPKDSPETNGVTQPMSLDGDAHDHGTKKASTDENGHDKVDGASPTLPPLAASEEVPTLATTPADFEDLFARLQPYISTQVLLPPGRLASLLRQV